MRDNTRMMLVAACFAAISKFQTHFGAMAFVPTSVDRYVTFMEAAKLDKVTSLEVITVATKKKGARLGGRRNSGTANETYPPLPARRFGEKREAKLFLFPEKDKQEEESKAIIVSSPFSVIAYNSNVTINGPGPGMVIMMMIAFFAALPDEEKHAFIKSFMNVIRAFHH
mmetsp:Transcript_226/g.286  ORF Transcript_226/g.286 Transcript_226/m.286 type:complete len:169 (-) Transcript_226:79-585(-)